MMQKLSYNKDVSLALSDTSDIERKLKQGNRRQTELYLYAQLSPSSQVLLFGLPPSGIVM